MREKRGKGGLLLPVRRSSFPFHLGGRDNKATWRRRRRRRPTVSHATYIGANEAGMEEGGRPVALSSIDTPLFFLLLEKRKGEWEKKKSVNSPPPLFFFRRSSSPSLPPLPPSAARSRSLLSVCENVCQSVRDPFQSPDPPRPLLLFPRLFRRMPPRLRGGLQDRRREKTFLPRRKRGKSFIFGFRHFLTHAPPI